MPTLETPSMPTHEDSMAALDRIEQRFKRMAASHFALQDRLEAAERLNAELVTALRELHRQIDPLDDPSCPACGMSFMHDDLCSYTAAQALLARIDAESSPKEPIR